MSALTPRETLELMLGHLGFVFEIEEAQKGEQVVLNIRTRDPGRLIGRDGHGLEDLQYLLNRALHGTEDAPARVIVDVENYREKEEQQFLQKVREAAQRVRRTGQSERLAPMNSFDRRVVHQAFHDDPEVGTRSEDGEGRLKSIVLELRTKKE
jgi:spoIIIJ-associated protein